LKAGEWFRRGLLLIVSPVRQPFWLLSGRNSTYPAVQISRAALPELVQYRAVREAYYEIGAQVAHAATARF
jgi:hypothetical protein